MDLSTSTGIGSNGSMTTTEEANDNATCAEKSKILVIEGPIIRKKKRGKGWLEINIFDERIDNNKSINIWIQTQMRTDSQQQQQQELLLKTEIFFVQSIIKVTAYEYVDPSKSTTTMKWIGQTWELIRCSPNIKAIPLVWEGIINGRYSPMTLLISDVEFEQKMQQQQQQQQQQLDPSEAKNIPPLDDVSTILLNLQNHRRQMATAAAAAAAAAAATNENNTKTTTTGYHPGTDHLHLIPPPKRKSPRKRSPHVRRQDLRLLDHFEDVGGSSSPSLLPSSSPTSTTTRATQYWKLVKPQYVPIEDGNITSDGTTISSSQDQSSIICMPVGGSNDDGDSPPATTTTIQFSQRRINYMTGKKHPQISWIIQRLMQIISSSAKNNNFPKHILDVGAGRGDLAIALAISFPQTTITIVDKNTTSLHAGKQSAIQILGKEDCNNRLNFVDADFKELIDKKKKQKKKSQSESIRRNEDKEVDHQQLKEVGPFETVDWVVALHACGDLSDLALEFAKEYSASFLLCPCCYTKRYCYTDANNPPGWTRYTRTTGVSVSTSLITPSSSSKPTTSGGDGEGSDDDDTARNRVESATTTNGCGGDDDDDDDDPSTTLGRLAELSEAPEVSKRAMTIINSMRLADCCHMPTTNHHQQEEACNNKMSTTTNNNNDYPILHLEEYDSQCSGRNIVLVGAAAPWRHHKVACDSI